MLRNNSSPLETKHLVSLGAGMLLPVPIIGELVLAYGLYPIIKETGIVKRDSTINSIISLGAAALARIELYQSFYLPSLEFISRSFL